MSRAKKSQSSTDPRILFGQRVAYLRKQIGWSQEKLALESNIARSYLGEWSVASAILRWSISAELPRRYQSIRRN